MTLAERLRTQMQWRGIKSQNQLARISGVPQSSIHRILTRNDAYAPARGTLQRLAAALDTTVPWLADGIDAAAPSASPAPGMAGPAAGAPDGYSAELHALMGKLPVEARKKIVAVVRLIVDGGGVAGTAQNTARPGQ